MLGGNLQWTSIPSRGSRNTPSRFLPQTPKPSDESSDWGQTLASSMARPNSCDMLQKHENGGTVP